MCKVIPGLCFVSLILMSSVSTEETLPKPSISLDPAGEITWGQNVRIICSTLGDLFLTATFEKSSSSQTWRKRAPWLSPSSSAAASLTFTRVTFDNEGSYRCRFIRGNLQSPLSDAVRLSVKVKLPKPSISANFRREVVWGNDVVVTCSVSTKNLGGTFTLLKTSDSSTTQSQETSSSSATFHIQRVDFDDEGLYHCQYRTLVSSRDFRSPISDPISLSVIVPLQPPEITPSSPDGALQWSSGSVEVTWGHGFVIACSIPFHYPGGLFILISNASTTTNKDTKPAVDRSASFEFPAANYDHRGNYSCAYEVTLSSRRFASAGTSIAVVIKLPLLMLVSSVSAGSVLLLLLLLVPLVIFLVWKRRRLVTQQGVPSLTPMTVRKDHCDDSDSDEEPNYVNVDPARCKNAQKAQTCGTSDEENEFSDNDDNDYVNVYQNCAEVAPDINYAEQVDIYENFRNT